MKNMSEISEFISKCVACCPGFGIATAHGMTAWEWSENSLDSGTQHFIKQACVYSSLALKSWEYLISLATFCIFLNFLKFFPPSVRLFE